MKKNVLKNQRGISLVVLMLTLIVMFILASVAISNIDIGSDIKHYNNMCADILLLENKVASYYRTNGQIPITGEAIADVQSELGAEADAKDNSNYYQIDISELYNVSLKYGGGNTTNKDIYIINEQSHEIYYLKGVELEENVYHRKK